MSQEQWERMTCEEKNKQLFINQKDTLYKFLERGAIGQA